MSVIKGRAAVSNESGRFEACQRFDFDDGWQVQEQPLQYKPKTEWLVDRAKTLINYNDSPDIDFDRSINPYRGCEHGCIY
ncbi:MAG: radical SAM protein, partial [Gammaproteobacteria bacterium]|nr:radical SAM protein [Gammaproteobacteria bacterium]